MTFLTIFALTALAPLVAAATPESGIFNLNVTRVRTLRDQPGDR